jgi:hypothetical protein
MIAVRFGFQVSGVTFCVSGFSPAYESPVFLCVFAPLREKPRIFALKNPTSHFDVQFRPDGGH